jgi:hypothetical protein
MVALWGGKKLFQTFMPHTPQMTSYNMPPQLDSQDDPCQSGAVVL